MLSEAKHLSADRDRPLAAKSMTMAHEDETVWVSNIVTSPVSRHRRRLSEQ